MLNAEQVAQRQAEIDALNQDEFDPEAQSRIAERIQQENIQSNMEAAFEHSPEAFGQVTMLYVKLEASFSTQEQISVAPYIAPAGIPRASQADSHAIQMSLQDLVR